ncbi:MAG: FAD-dependent oxidoreductase [Candidatus Thermoplasmatota archaeon]|nr:FAD-dependent oxidoreductase [Candidatus Thermoplasmatota archaeon]
MRAAVVGAGIGGLSAAALLRRQGHTVDVYEKEEMVGGRAMTVDGGLSREEYLRLLGRFDMAVPFAEPSVDDIFDGMLEGYRFDLGFHLMGGGDSAAPMQVLSSLGVEQELIGSRLGYIGDTVEYPYLSSWDKVRMLPRIMQLLFSRRRTIQALENVPMSETIQKYGRGKMRLTLELFPRLITTVNDLQRISTGETFWAQRELMGSHPVAYPVGGIGAIAEKMAGWLRGHGGRIIPRQVEEVVVEDGEACGVMADERHDYDLVVSNLPVQDTFSIVPRDAVPPEWACYIEGLTGTGSLCAWYALTDVPERLTGRAYGFIERDAGVEGGDAAGMIDFKPSHPRAGMAPPGRMLVQAYVICTPGEARDIATLQRLRNMLDANMERLIPDWRSRLEWALYPSIWHLDAVAKTIDNPKPSVATPLKHFYLVGDSTEGKGVAVNCAADSARLLMDELGG